MSEVIEFPKRGKQCKVCNSGLVHEVDKMLILGYPMTSIAEWLNQRKPGKHYSKQNIFSHRERHLDIHTDMMRRVLEKRQLQRGNELKELTRYRCDHLAAVEQYIIAGANQLLTDSAMPIKPSDWLKAIELYHKLGGDERSEEESKLLVEN